LNHAICRLPKMEGSHWLRGVSVITVRRPIAAGTGTTSFPGVELNCSRPATPHLPPTRVLRHLISQCSPSSTTTTTTTTTDARTNSRPHALFFLHPPSCDSAGPPPFFHRWTHLAAIPSFTSQPGLYTRPHSSPQSSRQSAFLLVPLGSTVTSTYLSQHLEHDTFDSTPSTTWASTSDTRTAMSFATRPLASSSLCVSARPTATSLLCTFPRISSRGKATTKTTVCKSST
jgi:hypothetical protein